MDLQPGYFWTKVSQSAGFSHLILSFLASPKLNKTIAHIFNFTVVLEQH